MNTDKAYIMGLVVGGGRFSADARHFHILLPYKKWGSAEDDPARVGVIATDILKVVKPPMAIEYGLSVAYTTGREWRIDCDGDTSALVADLRSYGIKPTSCLHKTADISKLVASFGENDNLKKRFVAGVADTIGSMAKSHRRFSDDVQIISFEISGYNYGFVCQLCNVLYDLGCVADQILWQHPNMQSGNDAYYDSWKKGNKLRVTLDAFSTFGSLAFKSKVTAAQANKALQSPGVFNNPENCEAKSLSVSGVTCVHRDEGHRDLPDSVRGGHFIHHKQICAAIGCPHAPCKEVDKILANAEEHVSPFTVWHKNDSASVHNIIRRDPIMGKRKYTSIKVRVDDVVKESENGAEVMRFRDGSVIYSHIRDKGYPLSIVLEAIAFILASETGKLNGKRPKGPRDEIIREALTNSPNLTVTVEVPDLLTPIVITDKQVAVLVGPLNSAVYKSLISYDHQSKYKMLVRPITEADLL